MVLEKASGERARKLHVSEYNHTCTLPQPRKLVFGTVHVFIVKSPLFGARYSASPRHDEAIVMRKKPGRIDGSLRGRVDTVSDA
eukprot:scaffold10816_cov149-Skeletonema_dohrnii-CCMP3373.AAC.6